MNVAGGANISKAAHDAIVKAALDHADEQGYCAEVEEFLEALGFAVPDNSTTVTIEVTLSGSREEVNRAKDMSESYLWNISHDYASVDDFTIKSVK